MSYLFLPELNTPEIIKAVRYDCEQLRVPVIINEIFVIYTPKYPHNYNHDLSIKFMGYKKGVMPDSYVGGHSFASTKIEEFTSNCGMQAITSPFVRIDIPKVKQLYVDLLEAYLFYLNKSLIVGSDVVYGPHYQLIKDYGKNWTFTPLTHNRNYPGMSDRQIGMYYKAIGEFGPQYEKWVKEFELYHAR